MCVTKIELDPWNTSPMGALGCHADRRWNMPENRSPLILIFFILLRTIWCCRMRSQHFLWPLSTINEVNHWKLNCFYLSLRQLSNFFQLKASCQVTNHCLKNMALNCSWGDAHPFPFGTFLWYWPNPTNQFIPMGITLIGHSIGFA